LKKILHILFALLYLTLASKVNASIHFCGGNITDISFFEHGSDDACQCGKMINNSCCEDFFVKCQVNDSNASIVKSIYLNVNLKLVSIIWQEVFNQISFNLYKIPLADKNAPIPPLIFHILKGVLLRI